MLGSGVCVIILPIESMVALSRVGFSDDRDEAVIHVMIARGGRDGHTDVMVFRRDGGRWRLAGSRPITQF
jgi:hypothetical protein